MKVTNGMIIGILVHFQLFVYIHDKKIFQIIVIHLHSLFHSPCDEHFDTRYAIGTHAAHHMKKLKKWSSLDAHPIYVTLKNKEFFLKQFFL